MQSRPPVSQRLPTTGARRQQETHDDRMPLAGGETQGRRPTLNTGIDLGPGQQERERRGRVSLGCGNAQGSIQRGLSAAGAVSRTAFLGRSHPGYRHPGHRAAGGIHRGRRVLDKPRP